MSTKGDKMNAIEQACVEIAEKLEAAYEIKFTWWPSPVQHCWKIRAAWMDQCNIHEAIAKIPTTEIYNLTDAKLLIKHKMFDLVDQLKPPTKEQSVASTYGELKLSTEPIWSFSTGTHSPAWITPDSTINIGSNFTISNAAWDTSNIDKITFSTPNGSPVSQTLQPTKEAKPPKVYTMDELYAAELGGRVAEQPPAPEAKLSIESIGQAINEAIKADAKELFKGEPFLKYLGTLQDVKDEAAAKEQK